MNSNHSNLNALWQLGDSLLSAGRFYLQFGHHLKAEKLLHEALDCFLKTSVEDRFVHKALKTYRKVAELNQQLSRYGQCSAYLDKADKLAIERFGLTGFEYAHVCNHWGFLYDNLGLLHQSLHYFDLCHKLFVQNKQTPFEIANSAAYLGRCMNAFYQAFPALCTAEKKADIDALFSTGLKIIVSLYGDLLHFKTADFMNCYAGYLASKGDWENSIQLYERVYRIRAQHHGPEHVNVAWTLNSYGNALFGCGKIEEARARHEQALEILFMLRTPPGNFITYTKRRIIHCLLSEQCTLPEEVRQEQISTMLREVIDFQNTIMGFFSARVAETRYLLALHCKQLKQFSDASKHFSEAAAIWRRCLGNHCKYALDCDRLVEECNQAVGYQHCQLL
eukprot:TRINITY_DN23040_c0_g2_i1.p1 TRINITY_DN23040_c0_g2~~TRINITY_DN23040_c0_g2_i1.p1  ORF type:complete len:407 (-),score=67.36 TRINITY_DN23040_c0_g2_i1:50-1225(-)